MSLSHLASVGVTRTGRSKGIWRLALDGTWLDFVMLATAALVCFATPLDALRLTTSWATSTQMSVALLVAIACAALVVGGCALLPGLLVRLASFVNALPLWTIIALGFLLRAAWCATFPAIPGSDDATYLQLASKLVAGEPYFIAGTFAYWPVGYPLFLSAWIPLVDSPKVAYLAANAVLYVVAALGIFRVGASVSGAASGKIAALLFALWPNYVASTATPQKELLIVALLPWVCALILQFRQTPTRSRIPLLTGALIGYCVLVQPSLQLLILGVTALFVVLADVKGPRALLPAVLVLASAAAVIAPWTLRNYQLLDRVVLVSTNGGSNLYRANNPLATGGYINEGAVKLGDLGELESDALGKELAVQWIKDHPVEFGLLALEKNIRFTSDDAVGVYATIKTGKLNVHGTVYAALKAGANAFWMLLWMTLAGACLVSRYRAIPLPELSRLPLWLWLYLFAIHSVFESAGKYHVPVAWVLAILLGSYVAAMAKAAR